MHQWHVYKSFQLASEAAARFLADKIISCLKNQEQCHVILPGGNTPSYCLTCLSEMDLPWEKIHWYPGDERVCKKNDSQRNDTMLEKNLWSHLPAGHFHSIPTELGIEQAVKKFSDELHNLDQIDIALLGMGDDGHTASLFPGNPALEDSGTIVAVYNSPKPPAERVSFGLSYLAKSKVKMVLAAGESKAEILKSIQQGDDYPVNRIGDIEWFVDKAAMAES